MPLAILFQLCPSDQVIRNSGLTANTAEEGLSRQGARTRNGLHAVPESCVPRTIGHPPESLSYNSRLPFAPRSCVDTIHASANSAFPSTGQESKSDRCGVSFYTGVLNMLFRLHQGPETRDIHSYGCIQCCVSGFFGKHITNAGLFDWRLLRWFLLCEGFRTTFLQMFVLILSSFEPSVSHLRLSPLTAF